MIVIPQTVDQAEQRDSEAGHFPPPPTVITERDDLHLVAAPGGAILVRGTQEIFLSRNDMQWLFDDGIHAAFEANC